MTITGIEPISKTRSKVYLDGEFSFVLYKGELRKYEIREGKALEEDIVHKLQTEVIPKRAKLRAMNLLKSRQYTEKELMDKLLQGGYREETAREALAYVKSYHYVDDARYAGEYIACHMAGRSLKEIEQKLMQKGIGREVIRSAVEGLAEEGLVSDERSVILKIMEKKHFSVQGADDKGKQRIYAYFYRKGFSMDIVRRVIEDMEDNHDKRRKEPSVNK